MKSGFKGARCGLTQTANGRVAHGLSHFSQGDDLLGYGTQRAALNQALDRLLLANCADPARNALTAAFLPEKGRDPQKNQLEADRVVKQHDDSGTQSRADGACALERERSVEFPRGNKGAGRAAQQHRRLG